MSNSAKNGAWNLFSPPNRPCAASPEEEQLPHDLIAAFKLRGAQSDWADLLEAAYYADRPLLDGEKRFQAPKCRQLSCSASTSA